MSAEVTASIPARPDFIRILRAIVASVGARLDLTYDRIDELRIAVGEACAHLLELPGEGTLTMRVTPDGARLVVIVTSDVRPADGWPPPGVEDSLAWRILLGLTDEARLELTDEGPAVRMEMELRAP